MPPPFATLPPTRCVVRELPRKRLRTRSEAGLSVSDLASAVHTAVSSRAHLSPQLHRRIAKLFEPRGAVPLPCMRAVAEALASGYMRDEHRHLHTATTSTSTSSHHKPPSDPHEDLCLAVFDQVETAILRKRIPFPEAVALAKLLSLAPLPQGKPRRVCLLLQAVPASLHVAMPHHSAVLEAVTQPPPEVYAPAPTPSLLDAFPPFTYSLLPDPQRDSDIAFDVSRSALEAVSLSLLWFPASPEAQHDGEVAFERLACTEGVFLKASAFLSSLNDAADQADSAGGTSSLEEDTPITLSLHDLPEPPPQPRPQLRPEQHDTVFQLTCEAVVRLSHGAHTHLLVPQRDSLAPAMQALRDAVAAWLGNAAYYLGVYLRDCATPAAQAWLPHLDSHDMPGAEPLQAVPYYLWEAMFALAVMGRPSSLLWGSAFQEGSWDVSSLSPVNAAYALAALRCFGFPAGRARERVQEGLLERLRGCGVQACLEDVLHAASIPTRVARCGPPQRVSVLLDMLGAHGVADSHIQRFFLELFARHAQGEGGARLVPRVCCASTSVVAALRGCVSGAVPHGVCADVLREAMTVLTANSCGSEPLHRPLWRGNQGLVWVQFALMAEGGRGGGVLNANLAYAVDRAARAAASAATADVARHNVPSCLKPMLEAVAICVVSSPVSHVLGLLHRVLAPYVSLRMRERKLFEHVTDVLSRTVSRNLLPAEVVVDELVLHMLQLRIFPAHLATPLFHTLHRRYSDSPLLAQISSLLKTQQRLMLRRVLRRNV